MHYSRVLFYVRSLPLWFLNFHWPNLRLMCAQKKSIISLASIIHMHDSCFECSNGRINLNTPMTLRIAHYALQTHVTLNVLGTNIVWCHLFFVFRHLSADVPPSLPPTNSTGYSENVLLKEPYNPHSNVVIQTAMLLSKLQFSHVSSTNASDPQDFFAQQPPMQYNNRLYSCSIHFGRGIARGGNVSSHVRNPVPLPLRPHK